MEEYMETLGVWEYIYYLVWDYKITHNKVNLTFLRLKTPSTYTSFVKSKLNKILAVEYKLKLFMHQRAYIAGQLQNPMQTVNMSYEVAFRNDFCLYKLK